VYSELGENVSVHCSDAKNVKKLRVKNVVCTVCELPMLCIKDERLNVVRQCMWHASAILKCDVGPEKPAKS
jgi:hypothetical protein